MRFFLCCLRPSGAPVLEEMGARYLATTCCRSLNLQSSMVGGIWTLIYSDEAGAGGSAVQWRSLVGIGSVRLDNRAELARRTGSGDRCITDLEIVVRLIAEHGEQCIRDILGDFAFVVWDTTTRALLAARDAFGVRPLYYSQQPDLLAFASRAELLAPDEQYDLAYLTALVAKASPPGDKTVYAAVRALSAGTVLKVRGGTFSKIPFWSPFDYVPERISTPKSREAREWCEVFRHLHAEAVRLRLTDSMDTWSTLSGGLDSSSVVSMAQYLARSGVVRCGLAGTITWVDSRGTGADEREYSDAVVRQYQVRNEKLFDFGYLYDDGEAPLRVDQPYYGYPFYAKDRRTCEIVRRSGGRVLLTGYGGDHLVMGNMFFFADWISGGHIRRAVDEMLRRAALGRVSFWQLAYRNAFLPLLPRAVRCALVREQRAPKWVPTIMIERYGLSSRVLGHRVYGGRVGHKYSDYIASDLCELPNSLIGYSALEDGLQVRHPYLYRPLVEFALQLPPELCVQPHAHKWILREAMRGVLPEHVRTRIGKGAMVGTVAWSIARKREDITRMLRDPVLAQLGCIDAHVFRDVVDAGPASGSETNLDIGSTLAIELWLQVRSGQWHAGARTTSKTPLSS